MTARRRLVIAALSALAAIGLLAVVLPDRGPEERTALGTRDRTTDDDSENEESTTTTAAELVAGDRPTDTLQVETVQTTATPTTATSTPATTAPQTSTTVAAGPTTTTPAPHNLRGRIAYLEIKGDALELWSMLPDATDRRAEVACPHLDGVQFGGSFDVSPDGAMIVRFCGTNLGSGSAEGYGLVLQAVDGSWTRTLLPSALFDLLSPRWSPDGRQIAVTNGMGTHAITIIDVATDAIRTIDPPPNFTPNWPSWSPDGARLTVGDLMVVDVATGAWSDLRPHVPLVPGGEIQMIHSSRWAPDGWIYFTEEVNDGQNRTLRRSFDRLDPATGTVQRLFDVPGVIGWPEFLPDGQILNVWSASWDMVTFKPDGSAWRTLPIQLPTAYAVARPRPGLATTG